MVSNQTSLRLMVFDALKKRITPDLGTLRTIFPFSKGSKVQKELFIEGKKKLNMSIDIVSLIEKLREAKALQHLTLNKWQRLLIEYFAENIITLSNTVQ